MFNYLLKREVTLNKGLITVYTSIVAVGLAIMYFSPENWDQFYNKPHIELLELLGELIMLSTIPAGFAYMVISFFKDVLNHHTWSYLPFRKGRIFAVKVILGLFFEFFFTSLAFMVYPNVINFTDFTINTVAYQDYLLAWVLAHKVILGIITGIMGASYLFMSLKKEYRIMKIVASLLLLVSSFIGMAYYAWYTRDVHHVRAYYTTSTNSFLDYYNLFDYLYLVVCFYFILYLNKRLDQRFES